MKTGRTILIAETEHWKVCVGQLMDSGRWIGFALGDLEDGGQFMNVFPQVGDGQMGVTSRDEAFRQACACVLNPEECYGEVETWHLPESKRATPEDYRCENCDEVLCDRRCEDPLEPEDIEDIFPMMDSSL